MGRRVLRAALVLGIACLVGATGVAAWGWWEFTRPGPLVEDRTVIIARGDGVRPIARRLRQAGVLRSDIVFAVVTRLTDRHDRLRAGEYAFPAAIDARGVRDLLLSGKTVVRRLTIAEGLTTAEVLARIEAAEGLDGTAPPAREGELLPDTYHYSWGDSRAAMVIRMRTAMRAAVARSWAERKPDGLLKNPAEFVILASIVERETGLAAERPKIAAVFLNRLKRRMRLQSDPTVVYALTEGTAPLGRALTRADLKRDHPYNTYRRAGLPPGPIANPGRATLAAVAHPTTSEALYFVADGTGGHAFAKTLRQHQANVRQWRRIQRQRKRDAAKQ